MKVCTDACILGAWAAARTQDNMVKNVLDIGCGTGLLSLMLSQKLNAKTDALEIDPAAATQAAENISRSPWVNNIIVTATPLQDFIPAEKYDLIISNPPFFEDGLRSADENNNAAKHDTTLRLDELILFVKKWLNDAGTFVVLLPFHRTAYLEKMANEHTLFVQEKLLVKQSPKHDHFRSILLLSKKEIPNTETAELTIHDNERNYTPEFESLLKDYYLKL